jgi:NAD(P)H-dependent flavin oxidoreductase YrpB (nitropropane dioxygenase family)
LTVALGRAGSFGFLAAGYKTPDAVRAEIDAARAAGVTFGVNVFVPTPVPISEPAFRGYARQIAGEGEAYGLDLANAALISDDDYWNEKIDLLVADPVPVVSFTFGLPDPGSAQRLQRAGSRVLATVTSAQEARAAVSLGVDGLVLQSAYAGGHSGTFTPQSPPPAETLVSLLEAVGDVAVPVLAAGGIGTAEDVRDALAAGAAAVLVGTLLLRTPEAGTSATHRAALADPSRTDTVVTRAFTGRPARALRNSFTDAYSETAPLGYPALHHLTRPLRVAAAAAGDPERVHLWAGTGWREAREAPAGEVVRDLARLA